MITRLWHCWLLPRELAERLLEASYYVCRDSVYAVDALRHSPLTWGEDEWVFPSVAIREERPKTGPQDDAEETERLPADVDAGQLWPDQLALVGLGTYGGFGFVFIRGEVGCVVMDGRIYPLEAEEIDALNISTGE